MRRYETIYILRPSLGEEEISTIINSTNSIITEEGGTIIDLNRWGMKKLAYLIKKEFQGYYVFCDYAGTPSAVAEIERKFRIDDAVLKYMTVKVADSISEEDVKNIMAEIEDIKAAEQEQEKAEATATEETAAPAAEEATPPAAE